MTYRTPRATRSPIRQSIPTLLAVLWLLTAFSPAMAQKVDPKKLPPPQDIELKDRLGVPLTKDVLLKATFYPGTQGNNSVPVILLHGWKGSRGDYAGLAASLQKDHGYAVLVPDLRGHGESTQSLTNSKKPLEPDRLGPEQYEAMVKTDLEACKSLLIEKNNAGELNIEKLCVVGAEMGAVVAMNWAVWDWHWPILATGKQGQDVKCLILLSPDWKVERGPLNMSTAVNEPVQGQFSVYIIYGQQQAGSSAVDANRIERSLARFHKNPNDPDSLKVFPLPTTLQGTKLLTAPELKVSEAIYKIIDARLSSKTYPWRDRSGPLN